jgi:hypothetical protein
MKHPLLTLFVFSLAACASKTPKPKYVEEKNQAKFSSVHELTQKPDDVQLAARRVLDKLTHDSTPQASSAVQSDENALFTGWVYLPASRDKYVQYDYNGTVRRKELAVRRIYGFTVSPSLAGSSVAMSVEEEVQDLDLTTGEPKGWKRVEAESASYDMLLRKLKEALSTQ